MNEDIAKAFERGKADGQAYRIALEDAIQMCEEVAADFEAQGKSRFLTEAGRWGYTSAAAGARQCINVLKAALEGKR